MDVATRGVNGLDGAGLGKAGALAKGAPETAGGRGQGGWDQSAGVAGNSDGNWKLDGSRLDH